MSLHRNQIHRRIYPLRVMGMALGGLAIAAVLHQNQAPRALWLLMVLTCLVWPHLAYLHARLSPDPHRAEACNLLIDSAIAGAWVPLMQYCLLPSVVLVMVTTFDKLSSGIRRLWLHSLPGMVGAALVLSVWLQPQPRLESPLIVVLCTLPLLILHTFVVSVASYRLIRTVSRQNLQLEELRRTDVQTGLYSREHWQQQAQAALDAFHATRQPMCLLIIDIDHFKSINDLYGHTVGDEVIRAAGLIIRQSVRAHDLAGRYGGDEFTVLCPRSSREEARDIARRIRERLEGLRLRDQPQLRVSASIGLAAAQPRHLALRDWMDAADTALYRAKHAGRNQVAGGDTHPARLAPA